jgi:hypothetical protein
MCREDPLKLYKIKFATELIKWLLNGWLVKAAGAKIDQATRKSHRHIIWVRALGLFVCTKEIDVLSEIYKERTNRLVQRMTKPRGNFLDILFWLGL